MNELIFAKQFKIMVIAMFFMCMFYLVLESTVRCHFSLSGADPKPSSTNAINTIRNFKTPEKLLRSNSTNDQIHCVILLKERNGRLGNRLFMFASAYGIARTHNCYLYIGEGFLAEMEDVFEIHLTFLIKKLNLRRLANQSIQSIYSDCKFHESIMRPYGITYLELTGFWQAYGHFVQFADEIRLQLQFKKKIVDIIIPFFRKILPSLMMPVASTTLSNLKYYVSASTAIRLIGIHIRRGDFLTRQQQADGRTVSTMRYIFEAMDYFSKRYQNSVLFIVASDDKDYCDKVFDKDPRVFVTPKSYSPAEDLAILAACEATIVTSGSFGWWAAFLANGVVVHDKEFPRNNSRLASICPRIWYYPPWFLFL